MHADVGRAAIEIDGRRGFGSGGGAAGERFGYWTTVDQLNPLLSFTSSIRFRDLHWHRHSHSGHAPPANVQMR